MLCLPSPLSHPAADHPASRPETIQPIPSLLDRATLRASTRARTHRELGCVSFQSLLTFAGVSPADLPLTPSTPARSSPSTQTSERRPSFDRTLCRLSAAVYPNVQGLCYIGQVDRSRSIHPPPSSSQLRPHSRAPTSTLPSSPLLFERSLSGRWIPPSSPTPPPFHQFSNS